MAFLGVNGRIRQSLLTLGMALMCTGIADATERAPWFADLYQFELRTTYAYSDYDQLSPESGLGQPHSSRSHLASAGLSVSPFQCWSFEVEGFTADTSQAPFHFSSAKAMARMQVTSDIIGDPVSLVVGAGLELPTDSTRNDLALEYHGDYEVELHAAIGKELATCRGCWVLRAWGVAGMTLSNLGSPYVFAEGNGELQLLNGSQIGAFVRTRAGLGERDLDLTNTFHGYSQIEHRSLETGVRYRRSFLMCSHLVVEYGQRVHAENSPDNVHRITATLCLPFSL